MLHIDTTPSIDFLVLVVVLLYCFVKHLSVTRTIYVCTIQLYISSQFAKKEKIEGI